MLKLKLKDIKKTYRNGEVVSALKGVSLDFRQSEFVAILGPSGCGKTTLLNIIGGLDRYDSGDLVIGGTSTTQFRDQDWDSYRNRSIGFVFQSYNLISHQSVLQNVEIALTLSGVSASERKRRATQALTEVGLADQVRKKPNQLSGGQMQRVAIARALVNNPDIILADEPTGALDSQASIQLMEILRQIAKTRLVIMVTHNSALAEKYSNRIIRLLDGEIQSDSNPPAEDREATARPSEQKRFKMTSMSLATATGLSFRNLLTKRGRTVLTSIAGSIGIIGVGLVLALSSGLSGYMSALQQESLAGFPIIINEVPQTLDRGGPIRDGENPLLSRDDDEGKFTDENVLIPHDPRANMIVHRNLLTEEYFAYVAQIESALPGAVSVVSYARAVEMNVLAKAEDSVVRFATTASGGSGNMGAMFAASLYWQEMDDNQALILSLYDLLGEGSRLPKDKGEIALVVDEYNRIDRAFFEKIGLLSPSENYKLTDFVGRTIMKVVPNNSYYTQTADGLYRPASVSEYGALYDNGDGIELTITAILRPKATSTASSSYLSTGVVFTTALTDYIVNDAANSEIALAQVNSDRDVLLNTPFSRDSDRTARLQQLGADSTPTGIRIYPANFAGKASITTYLDAYNLGRPAAEQVVYTDMAQMIESMFVTLLNTVTYVLIAFAAISLVVSTMMIAIIIYVSVIERTKEIGILRSVGARKKDIARVFNAEALLIGLVAGLIGVGATYLIQIPVNSIIERLVNVSGIASLPLMYAAALVLGSMSLTLVAGFIPSKMAAQRDPVAALRAD